MVYFEKSQPAPKCLAVEKEKKSGDYNCDDVIDRLIFDFKNKCYICEQANISSTQTEHFEPHQGDINKKFDWDNLFWSCNHCNNTKSDKYYPLLNCTIKEDCVETRLQYKAISFPLDDIQIIELDEDIKTLNTKALLLAIYNGTTDRKQREAENIKSLLLDEIILFQSALQGYYKNRFDVNIQKKYLDTIEEHLSRSSDFTAFKRWIVRERTVYMSAFGHFLEDINEGITRDEIKIENKNSIDTQQLMYNEYKQLNLPEIDREILEFWDANDIFKKSVEQRDADNSFVFYEGPPSANGMPGIHHVMARAMKDIFCRYQTLKGKRVERKGGWDTHGLPIELQVEKELGIKKEDIGIKVSVDDYNKACKATVMRFKDRWDDMTRRMGHWLDLDNPYITFENDYMESCWHLLKKMYDKNLLYKGYTIQPYSPAAGTGLSSHELNMPGAYKEVTDTSAVAMFKVIEDDKSAFLFSSPLGRSGGADDIRILAWTTTPWTLPSNTALTVGPKITYVKIKCKSPYLEDKEVSVILAEALVSKWFGGKNQPQIIESQVIGTGADLEGLQYEQLMPYGNPLEEIIGSSSPLGRSGGAFRVICGDFVTTEDGTGIVHTAPSFGADDMKVARTNGIGALTLVDKRGRFLDTVGEFSGEYVKGDYLNDTEREAEIERMKNATGDDEYTTLIKNIVTRTNAYLDVNERIILKLQLENKLFKKEKYVHNYPHCWRTDKPILYYPLDSWFIRASSMKERMSELNKTINWKPAATGEGRFGKWLENLNDWNLSRSRYWGTPLPIWRTEDGMEEICIGSAAQLGEEIEKANKALNISQVMPLDFHRPYIDEVVLVSPSGKKMTRELDLIDVWFDSGAMPFAQWHYPMENQEKWKAAYPADYISEGVDQTRGWFYTLHAISVMVEDSVAFKNVVSTGLVLDKNGQKMSKRLGNAIDPFETIDKHGADVTRWYMTSNSQPWDNLKFDLEGLTEVRNKFFGTLYNTYNFFAMYANVDGFSYKENNIPLEERPEIDRWILSKLNSLIKEVNAQYADYEPTNAARLIEKFVDGDLSNWYVRLCRRRFWKGDYSTDKISAYQTLYTCMEAVAKLMSPIAPFFGDWLYRNLNNITKQEKHESVHLASFPRISHEAINLELEQRMDYAQRISSLILSLRKAQSLRVRQPLMKVMLPVVDERFTAQIEGVKDLILAETNIKQIEFITDTSNVVKKRAKANFKAKDEAGQTLGARLGKDMKTVAAAIEALANEDIITIEKSNIYSITVAEKTYNLAASDFDIISEDIPGWLVANDGALIVALDITLNDELIAEGTARDIVNRIQNVRKEADFDLTDTIEVELENSSLVKNMFASQKDLIANEVLAKNLKTSTDNTILPNSLQLNEDQQIDVNISLNRPIINKILIKNFKSIKKQEIDLKQLNILIGCNGAGKSNFIEFFKLVENIRERNLGDYIGNDISSFLHFGRKNSEDIIGALVFGNEVSNHKNALLFQLKPKPNSENVYISTLFDFYNRGKGNADSIKEIQTWHPLQIDVNADESSLIEKNDYRTNYLVKYMRGFRIYHFHDTGKTSVLRLPSISTEDKFLESDGKNLAYFLYYLQKREPKILRQIEQTVQLVAPYFDRFDDLSPNKIDGKVQLKWFEKGNDYAFNAHYFSDGTLRFIALTTLLLQPDLPKTIIIDEPELGLHPRAVSTFAEMLKVASQKCQVIICTQSVELVSQFEANDIITVDRKDNQSIFKRWINEELAEWTKEYSMGEIWEKNLIGGRI